MLSAITHQLPPDATTSSPTLEVNTLGETLRQVSIIEASPFPLATAPQSLKIGILPKIHPSSGLALNFPGEDPISSD
uniref:Uncharacterized protein n=1 Tax=Romanomermis culicivorax TaxID=13658 RepID=A0A915KI71_ROMCU